MEKQIFIGGGVVDFYVNKTKYDGYKTNRGRWSYVYNELMKYLSELHNMEINGLQIRDISITSNNFWGIDKMVVINDLGYCEKNQRPLNNEKTTIRIFQIDIIGVVLNENFKSIYNEIKTSNLLLSITNGRCV